jgi:hemerythrin
MPLLTWNNQYSVNVRQCDTQHKLLIQIINDLHAGMSDGHSHDIMRTILDDLLIYIRVHFRDEEELMQKNGYPGFAEHKKKHDEFVKRVMEINSEYQGGRMILSMDVMEFLRSWLVDHIQTIDKRYSAHLNAKGVS